VLEAFAKKFAPCGFRKSAFYPCYGMAEASLMISGGKKAAEPVVLSVDTKELETAGRAISIENDLPTSRKVVGCGEAPAGHEILIVDPKNLKPCSEGDVGEIWFQGPSVSRGYWEQPEETEKTFVTLDPFRGKYLRTGDLGFCLKDELFITGRMKDLIILRGRNLYPQDIELTVRQSHPALVGSMGAAFSLEHSGQERVVVVQEVDRAFKDLDLTNELIPTICEQVFEHHEVQLHAVSLVRKNSIPLTSSGKIQRHAAQLRFLNHTLDELTRFEVA
jgi:acyl-CoA synthetase (AMP-forming)/AMP-acid ligase II